MNLEGKVAIVTGASRGIGKEIVRVLATNGAKIIATNRDAASAKSAEEQFRSQSLDVSFIPGDIASADHCDALVKACIEKFGKLDILVNNAGITADNLLVRMSDDQWNSVITTNLNSVFYLCRAVAKPMMKARTGRIINISSVVGHTGNPGQVNYTATKAGLIGMTKSMAKELASRGITCNAVSPGFIGSDMTEKLNDEQKSNILKSIPMGRMGSAEDIANAVNFLSSDQANYITGTVIHVNGGLY